LKAQRATDLGVRNLELLFTPLGMPLVVKGSSGTGTTSILVRGGAGSGKTTLAVALAHSIARMGGGFTLYLTTEFAPVEIAFKATLLGLEEALVVRWDERAAVAVGGLAVHHLALLASPDDVLTSDQRKRSAIDAVWGLLEGEAVGAAVPVRAVVIDAFNLPDPGASEGALRADLVRFVQSLEEWGISTVLVEEAGPGASEWLSFVVDVVFELGFSAERYAAEPGTGELRRKLTCRKSRYASALPGPHDYGLDPRQRPSVWPDLLAVVSTTRDMGLSVPLADRKAIVVPFPNGTLKLLAGGALVVNELDQVGTLFLGALAATPGIRTLRVKCSSLTRFSPPDGGPAIEVFDGAGPHALGDAVARTLVASRANVVVFDGLSALIAVHGATALAHILQALRELGVLVCVHETTEGARRFIPFADLVVSGFGGESRAEPLRYRFAATWLIDAAGDDLAVLGALPSERTAESENVRSRLAEIYATIVRGDWPSIRPMLDTLGSTPPDPVDTRISCRTAPARSRRLHEVRTSVLRSDVVPRSEIVELGCSAGVDVCGHRLRRRSPRWLL
jgi:KaiC/GvpD/RAD55 family RecA-like ATPase